MEPIERYLAWLSRIERAPTTVRAYAHDLKTFWAFVESRGIEWDRLLFALLAGTGMRIGQALGLPHSDVGQQRRIAIVAREDNANGARGKGSHGWVPITSELVRLHSDYMHLEYGDLDSDYVFVNLWGGRVGHAMTYASVHEIVLRTGRAVGFDFAPHQLRHTYATVVRRGGVPVEIVSKLLCHRSVKTTSDIYLHTSPEDLHAELGRAGVLERLGALT